MPANEVALRMLNPIGAVPSTMEPELEALSADLLVFGMPAILLQDLSAMARRRLSYARLLASTWNSQSAS